ncbi:MarR family winged helix-turn-helix transcriptional regulator [Marisediminicola senii]|uniref:MarR family winged helix-turn-helix transcriptional regulator n=1 Tax=Marisediminicola senii TaxID=2711233 RepID=UPI0013EBBA65|nr:MarR family transcriptional regulator [Marisediminicola senii]
MAPEPGERPDSDVTIDDPLSLDQQVCFALSVASRLVVGAYTPVLKPLGLTHPQYLVMLALWEKEPRSLSELANALRLEPPTLSPLLKRLEAAGFITRQRSVDDERNLAVRLTTSGRELRAQAIAVPPQVVAALGAEERDLTDLLARLTGLIQQISPSVSGR